LFILFKSKKEAEIFEMLEKRKRVPL
jgi:hypothetical protein